MCTSQKRNNKSGSAVTDFELYKLCVYIICCVSISCRCSWRLLEQSIPRGLVELSRFVYSINSIPLTYMLLVIDNTKTCNSTNSGRLQETDVLVLVTVLLVAAVPLWFNSQITYWR